MLKKRCAKRTGFPPRSYLLCLFVLLKEHVCFLYQLGKVQAPPASGVFVSQQKMCFLYIQSIGGASCLRRYPPFWVPPNGNVFFKTRERRRYLPPAKIPAPPGPRLKVLHLTWQLLSSSDPGVSVGAIRT